MSTTSTIIDLSNIDFDAVAISPEEVGAVNKQTGDMRHLDHVIWVDDASTQMVGVKEVRHDEFWVPCHIPGRPIFPGVLMIEAAAQLSCLLYRSKINETRFIGFTRCEDCSFRGQVVPGDTLHLLSVEKRFQPRRFVCTTQGVVNGKVVFGATVTGMVI